MIKYSEKYILRIQLEILKKYKNVNILNIAPYYYSLSLELQQLLNMARSKKKTNFLRSDLMSYTLI